MLISFVFLYESIIKQMKKIFLFFVSISLLGISSCSSDDDKNEVNFITARFNNVEQKFNIISVDMVNYDGYTDIEVSATMSSDPTKSIEIKSQYGVTGEDIIWGVYYLADGKYYEINVNSFISNVTENSSNRFTGTFSGPLIEITDQSVMNITGGSFDIVY